MLKLILISGVAVVAAILIYAATRPGTFRVQRSVSIDAPREKIFPLIDDLHRHEAWSPWEKKDPAMRRTHSGAASGKGAVYEWNGNREIGQGRMEITESSPPSRLVMAMHFIRPFDAHNTVEFTLEPQGAGTFVTWAIYGPRPYCAKLMQLFFSVDKMIGREFETGLASLKALAES